MNSSNLFDPTTLGVADLADIASLSSVLPEEAADYSHLLLLSQESGRMLEVDRKGHIVGRLDIGVAGQNEGITIDSGHVIYTANELGGGTDHPQLWVFTPTKSSNAVGVGSNLYITFNQPVQAGQGDIVIDNANGDSRTINVTDKDRVSFDGDTVAINPKQDLTPASTYRIQINAGVLRDASGENIPNVANLTDLRFTTVADSLAPTLESTEPAAGAADVNGSHVILNFNEPVEAGTGQVVLRSSNASDDRTIDVTDSTQVTFSGDSVDINPSVDLQPGSTYSLTVDKGAISDIAGNGYAGISDTKTLMFRTAGSSQPTALDAGDLLFTGVNGSGTDAISFLLLKAVNAGTQIGFTDKDYAAGPPATFGAGEASYIWTADRNYPAGTMVTIQTKTLETDKGIASGTSGGVSKSGETYYAFMGRVAPDGNVTVDHFLAAINSGGQAAGDIPAAAESAHTYFEFAASNAKYTASFDKSDLPALAARIRNTSANWAESASGFPLSSDGSLFAAP